jgi:hypothetical protein
MFKKPMFVVVMLSIMAMLAMGVASVPGVSRASSHREAPAISQDPAADNTDTYIFRSPDHPGTITLVANYYPYEGPAGGPNFYRFGDDVLYEFHIDNNGNAKDDITYQFQFKTTIKNPNTFLYNTGQITSLNDPDWTLRQTYSVDRIEKGKRTRLASGLQTPPSNVGTHSIPNYATLRNAAIYAIGNHIKVFAGQRADPFFADVGAIFDLLTIRGGIPAGFSSGGKNTFAKQNLQTLALQVPIDQLTACKCMPGAHDDPVVGFWASASRRSMDLDRLPSTLNGNDHNDREWVQVSRLGLPLVNEAVIPMSMKDKFNASQPVNDVANFAGPVVKPELATLLNVLYGVPVPPTPRTDLVEILLKGVPGLNRPVNVVPSDMLRLNVTTPVCETGSCAKHSNLGVIGGDLAGFPNGRRLNDDVVDVAERVVAGILSGNACCTGFPNNALGDGVNAPYVQPMASFPYVADPYDGFNYP